MLCDHQTSEGYDGFCHVQPPDLKGSQQLSGTCPPEIPLLLQPLLKALATVGFEFQKDRQIILKSAIDEPLKQRAIATLAKRRQERRAPYLQGIGKLERQPQKKAA